MKRFFLILAFLAGCWQPCPAQERNALSQVSQVGGRTSPDGKEEITIDLPGNEHLKNCGGVDGLGLCVFTSLAHEGRWQNNPTIANLQATMKSEKGGGWPEKVDQMLKKHAPGTAYVQYSGNDPAILKLALHTGRMPCVTYGYSPRYAKNIAHMVNLVHLSERWTCVLDNNFPGENAYEWMTPAEFLRRWKLGGGGWTIILLDAPPPPIPTNGQEERVFGQCRNGQCGPVRVVPQPVQPAPQVYDWSLVPGREEWYALRCDSVQIARVVQDDRQVPSSCELRQGGVGQRRPAPHPASGAPDFGLPVWRGEWRWLQVRHALPVQAGCSHRPGRGLRRRTQQVRRPQQQRERLRRQRRRSLRTSRLENHQGRSRGPD